MQDVVGDALEAIEQPEVKAVIEWLIPLAIFVGGVVIGLFIEWVIVRFLHRIAKKTAWKWDDVIARSLRRTISGLIIVSSFMIAATYAPIGEQWLELIKKIVNSLAALIVIIFVARLVGEFLQLLLDRMGKTIGSTSLISKSAKFAIIVIGVMFVINSNWFEITPLIGALGIGGLAAALALQDTLSNLFSGFQIIATRQVRPGDYVSLEGGQLGVVTDVSWRNVTIKSHPDENMIIVPNSKLATNVMINYSLPRRMLMESVEVGVAYDSDLDKVEAIAQEVAEEVVKDMSGSDPSSKPQIRFREFGDSAITFQVRMFLPQLKGRAVYKHEFIKRLHKRFNAEGIEIPFPIRNVYIRGDETK